MDLFLRLEEHDSTEQNNAPSACEVISCNLIDADGSQVHEKEDHDTEPEDGSCAFIRI